MSGSRNQRRHAFAMELPDRFAPRHRENGPRRDALEQVVVVFAVREREDERRQDRPAPEEPRGAGGGEGFLRRQPQADERGERPRQDDVGNVRGVVPPRLAEIALVQAAEVVLLPELQDVGMAADDRGGPRQRHRGGDEEAPEPEVALDCGRERFHRR